MPRDYKYHFKQNLIKVSDANNFEDAKKEWRYFSKFKAGRGRKLDCICSKKNIKKITRLEHKRTEKIILIGSDCIYNHFPQFRSKNSG